MKWDGASLLKIFSTINGAYAESMARGATEAYLEGVQIGRLGLSLEMCLYPEGSAECMDWRRGYFNELGKVKR